MATSNSDPDSRSLWPSRDLAWPALICLLGFALLLYQLDAKSLWGDETFRAYTTDIPLGDVRGFISRVQMHVLPPLYPLFLWMWRSIAGSTEFALRFLSVVFATIALTIVYRLGLSTLGKRAGLAVLALAATSPFLVLSGRMVQYYSLLLLLSASSCWLFLELLRGRGTWVKWVAYILVCTMAVYTQYLAASVLITQGLVALSQTRKRRDFVLRLVAALAVVVLLLAPTVGLLVPQSTGRFADQDAFSTSSLKMSAFALVYPFFAWTVGGSIFPWNPLGLLGALLGLSLAVAGYWAVATEGRSRANAHTEVKAAHQGTSTSSSRDQPLRQAWPDGRITALVCAGFIFLPLCLSVLALRAVPGATGDPFVANRAVFCVPFLYVLMGAGILRIDRISLRSGVLAALALVFGVSLINYYQGREFHNPLYVLQTDELANIIHQQAQPGDVFVSDEMTAFGYYIVRVDRDAIHFNSTASEDARDYIERHNPESVWLILLCRAVETESSASLLLAPWLPKQGYYEQLSFGHSPQDATMARLQELALGRPACRHKITVTKYTTAQ